MLWAMDIRTRAANPITKALRAARLGVGTMTFRQATIGDAPHLARFVITAHGGTYEAVYDGLFPDQSIESVVCACRREQQLCHQGVTVGGSFPKLEEADQ